MIVINSKIKLKEMETEKAEEKREIKFRVWQKHKNKMRSFEELKDCGWNFEDFNFPGSQAIFMGYTGLRDRNGTEIYEGDILGGNSLSRNPNDELVEVEVAWGNAAAAWIIVDGKCWKRGSTKDSHVADLLSSWLKIYDFEVIGNIYENPELIQNDKIH